MRTPRTAKSTIKNDPFAAVIPLPTNESELPVTDNDPEPQQPVTPPEPPSPAVNTDRPRTEAVPVKRGKQKLTVHLPAELAERVKNAAYWNPRLTIGGIAEQGIKSAIEKHEREHGGKYPPREGALTGGRPIK